MEQAEQDVKNSKDARNEAIKEAKKAKEQAFNERIKHAQMKNKEFDEKNPGFKKYQELMKSGPVNGIYKMFASAVKDVVNVVKMFFFWIYNKSMMTFLPFVMTMSFGFSFVKYLFQKARNV